ncbi:MAG: hypothetical protein EP344_01255 [Bacteroidetes bacterium]|nr:MAG: hypothetical protein EP344_01255 [Bacteroidota bacterium]
MRTLILLLVSALFLLAVILPACRHELVLPPLDDNTSPQDTLVDPADYSGWPCDPDTVYFESQVLPLLISQCARSGCHDAQSHKEGVILIDYQTVINTGEVRPFKPDNSELYKVIVSTNPGKRMPEPPNAPLTAEQKALIRKWIEQGALNNSCNENYGGCDTTGVTYTNFVSPLLATYCVGCHSGTNPSGNLRLTNYTEVTASAQSGKLFGAIAHEQGYVAMPQGGAALSPCFVNKIQSWVETDMPE